MKTIYVVIGHDYETAWIDEDCVFGSFAEAKAMSRKLYAERRKDIDMDFTVEEIQIKED